MSTILEISSSPLIKTFSNKFDECQLINDSHIYLQVEDLEDIKDDEFQGDGIDVLQDVRTLLLV